MYHTLARVSCLPCTRTSPSLAAFLASLLSGVFAVFVRHLHLFVLPDGTLAAPPLPGDEATPGTPEPVSGTLHPDVMIDIISNIRAALFFAVQELKVSVLVFV